MTDTELKALAERVISEYTVTVCDRNTCDESGYHAAGIAKAAAVLRSALTPEWKPVPDELPEGAVIGCYMVRDKGQIGRGWQSLLDCAYIESCKGRDTKHEYLGPLAAFDTNDNPVANPMRNSMSGAHKEA